MLSQIEIKNIPKELLDNIQQKKYEKQLKELMTKSIEKKKIIHAV